MTNGRVVWLSEQDPPDAFPPVGEALREPDGLLAAGGDLCTPRLLAAYRQGIFPWYDDGQPVLWWSPDPRCVFGPGDLHLSRRFLQEARKSTLAIRVNTAFADVIQRCAEPRRHQQGTWITRDMRDAYRRLHTEGWAHSIEIWDEDELAGGLYGLGIGRAFFGESMFSAEPAMHPSMRCCSWTVTADGREGTMRPHRLPGPYRAITSQTLGARALIPQRVNSYSQSSRDAC